ncbi:hypothetical protein CC2G_011213 [Coprinopsis cinerea AmutBmut pab1-1]|nr:hypothetical protein CC2G_011213 [Coprinopsis cinerea AmutBmut pab1-1]KAG2014392.1 hypothetical protein CC2G_011213 [Coprinopsis cinerea AmutBmut pab1-1]
MDMELATEDSASSVAATRVDDASRRFTITLPSGNGHWTIPGAYSMGCAIITLVLSAWLTSKFNAGDKAPSQAVDILVHSILGSSIWTVLFFAGLWLGYPRKRPSRNGLFWTLVTWVMWLGLGVTTTVMYEGTYSCPRSPFPHCAQLITLQVFIWVQCLTTGSIIFFLDDKPTKRESRKGATTSTRRRTARSTSLRLEGRDLERG